MTVLTFSDLCEPTKNLIVMTMDPMDYMPEYHPAYQRDRECRPCRRNCCSNFLVAVITLGMCAVAFCYYEAYMIRQLVNLNILNDTAPWEEESKPPPSIEDVLTEMESMKKNMELTNAWIKQMELLFKILDQESICEKIVQEALDLYDSDKIGIFDHASVYACGTIISTPETHPYPSNNTFSFFNFLNVDVLSNSESILQPTNMPGNCFAFHGSTGTMRIRLGKKILIKAVTMEHVKYAEDTSHAPKDFIVNGLHNPEDTRGTFLGQFAYNLSGRAYQTFRINTELSIIPFEYVELIVLSNYGNREFTCVYRFRVHSELKRKEGLVKSANNH